MHPYVRMEADCSSLLTWKFGVLMVLRVVGGLEIRNLEWEFSGGARAGILLRFPFLLHADDFF